MPFELHNGAGMYLQCSFGTPARYLLSKTIIALAHVPAFGEVGNVKRTNTQLSSQSTLEAITNEES